MSHGDWTTFLTRPVSLALILINLLILVGPWLLSKARMALRRAAQQGPPS